MDFSIFNREDFHTKLQIAQIQSLRTNEEDDAILIRGFVGGADGCQYAQFNTAMSEAKAYYAERNIIINCEMIPMTSLKI